MYRNERYNSRPNRKPVRSPEPSAPVSEDLIVTISPEGRPTLKKENIQKIRDWMDVQSQPTRDTVRELGGAVLSTMWMAHTMKVSVPYENLNEHIETIRTIPNVQDVSIYHAYQIQPDLGW